MNNIKIGIAYHRQAKFAAFEPFLPIQVGAVYHEDLGIQKDSDGINISKKNPYCSEMSATYWLWKNTTADYKGLFHYRRFLSFHETSLIDKAKKWLLYYLSKCASVIIRDARYEMPVFSEIHIQEKDVESELKSFSDKLLKDIESCDIDCYAMKPLKNSTRTMKVHMVLSIGTWHTNAALSIIKEHYPDFYPYVEKLLTGGTISAYNMLIAKNDIFEEYCSLMFGILEKYHSMMNEGFDDSHINKAMLRDSGYVAEVVTGAFINMKRDQGSKIKLLNCTFVDMEVGGMSSVTPSLVKRVIQMFKN